MDIDVNAVKKIQDTIENATTLPVDLSKQKRYKLFPLA